MSLAAEYTHRLSTALEPAARALEMHLRDLFGSVARVDRINARAKSVERFLAKASTQTDGAPKYAEPLVEIQDQIGARIVVFYNQDVDSASAVAEAYFRRIERREVQPTRDSEFTYFGKHYILFTPAEAIPGGVDSSLVPQFFELQIKTLFQHAWSEASHDVGYKPLHGELSAYDRRLLAFASAQAWGADNAFAEIFGRVSSIVH